MNSACDGVGRGSAAGCPNLPGTPLLGLSQWSCRGRSPLRGARGFGDFGGGAACSLFIPEAGRHREPSRERGDKHWERSRTGVPERCPMRGIWEWGRQLRSSSVATTARATSDLLGRCRLGRCRGAPIARLELTLLPSKVTTVCYNVTAASFGPPVLILVSCRDVRTCRTSSVRLSPENVPPSKWTAQSQGSADLSQRMIALMTYGSNTSRDLGGGGAPHPPGRSYCDRTEAAGA